jgi:peptidoglycan/LPS O-acetylase OafA/YrhL
VAAATARAASGVTSAGRPVEIKALLGARALPPLMVVLFHYASFHHFVPAAAVLGPPVMKGYLWVDFFFALSGFVLTHVYGGREFPSGGAIVNFVKLRLARLYPVHLATLLSIALLMGALRLFDPAAYAVMYAGAHAPLNTWPTFVANLFLVQAWNIVPDLTWNAPAWFVSVEFLLCLLFPLFLALSRDGAWRGALLIAFGIGWLVLLGVPSGVGLDITFDNGIFRGMAGFAIGVGMAMIHREVEPERIPAWVWHALQAVVAVFLVWAVWFSGADHTAADIWTALAEDALILALAFDRGFLAHAFASPVMRKLGEWSYGIYMGQLFWLQFARWLEQHRWIDPHAPLEPVALLLVCIVWGALLAKFIEQPANAALRRSLAPRNQATAA